MVCGVFVGVRRLEVEGRAAFRSVGGRREDGTGWRWMECSSDGVWC